MKSALHHYLCLGGIMLLGLGLRFYGIDTKPLWLDEVLTALFGLGLNYDNIPKQQLFSLEDVSQILSYQPQTSCAQIAQNLVQQSNHPPLFFCGLHTWLGWLQSSPMSLAWQLRSLPALFGTIAIGLTYLLNRVAFGPVAGLMGAGLMAASPFGVDLSQEARHYTLPICLGLLGLTLLVLFVQRWSNTQVISLPLIVAWGLVNGLGFYTHYFFLYIFVAQVVALAVWLVKQRRAIGWSNIWKLGLGLVSVASLYLPGLLTLFSYADNSETQWLQLQPHHWVDWLVPPLRLAILLLTMVTMVPLETQSFWHVLPLFMVFLPLLLLTLGWAGRGMGQLQRIPATTIGGQLLLGFTLAALGLVIITIYLLRRDLSLGSRYSFIYFPSIIALLAASLVGLKPALKHWQRSLVIGLALGGTIFVISNQALLKPYELDRVIHRLLTPPTLSTPVQPVQPLTVIVAYNSSMRLIVSLSYALEMAKQAPASAYQAQPIQFAFLDALQTWPDLHNQLGQISGSLRPPLNLWLVGEEPTGQPHLGQAKIDQWVQQQGCLPQTQAVFRGSYGTVFRPYHCSLDLAN
jgi:uncharacterized membrane protein